MGRTTSKMHQLWMKTLWDCWKWTTGSVRSPWSMTLWIVRRRIRRLLLLVTSLSRRFITTSKEECSADSRFDSFPLFVRFSSIQLTQCNTNNCGEPNPIYMAFRQGGNNVDVVLRAPDESDATWNFLYAIANTIYTPAEYGEGDVQTVDTVYGRCRVHFGRPEDKRFRRIIDNCELGHGVNFTKFEGVEHVNYEQDVWYTWVRLD